MSLVRGITRSNIKESARASSREIHSAEEAPEPAAPTITSQPQDATVESGGSVSFTVLAGGFPAPTYQWQSNSGGGWTNIPGATSATLNGNEGIDPFVDGEQFRCVVTNSEGSVTSDAATLTVYSALSAGTLSQDSNTDTSITVTWTAASGGLAPVTAQLQINDGTGWADVTGEDSSPATATGLTAETSYDLRVVWTDSDSNTATSNVVTVVTNAETSTLLNSLTAYWAMDEASGNRVDEVASLVASETAGTLNNRPGRIYAKTASTNCVDLDGTNTLTVANDAAIAFGEESWSLAGWFMNRSTGNGMALRRDGNYSLLVRSDNDEVVFEWWDSTATKRTVTASIAGMQNRWVFVYAYYDASTSEIGVSVDNTAAVTQSVANAAGTSANPLYMGQTETGTALLDGAMQGIGFWRRLLTSGERDELWNDGLGNPYPFSDPVTLSGNASILAPDALQFDTISSGESSSPNGGYTAEPIIFSRTIGAVKYQVAAYYDIALKVIVGVRSDSGAGFGSWTWRDTGLTLNRTSFDAHETISVAIDGDGYLHITWDNRNEALLYRRSDAPLNTWTGGLTSALSMSGSNENSVGYQMFFVDGSGTLHCTWRNGMSGNGDQILQTYDESTQTWSNAAGTGTGGVLLKGTDAPTSNPYLFRSPEIDGSGLVHFLWTWRETGNTNSDRDLHHLRWDPSTGSLTTMAGVSVTAPIGGLGKAGYADTRVLTLPPGTANIAVEISDMCVDSSGHPHAATVEEATDGSTEVVHYYYDGSAWGKSVLSARTNTFFDQITRPICFFTPAGRLVFLYTDSETFGDTRLRFYYSADPFNTWIEVVAEDLAYATGSHSNNGPNSAFDRRRLEVDNVLDLLWFPTNGAGGSGPAILLSYDNIDAFLTGSTPAVVAGSLSLASRTNDSLTLSWTDAAGTETPITAQLQQLNADGVTWDNVAGGTASPVTVSGLVSGEAERFRVLYTGVSATTATSNELEATPLGTYDSEVLSDSPIAYWRLDDLTLPAANDATGNNNHAIYLNSPTLEVPGAVASGTAVTFNGSTQFGKIENSLVGDSPTAFTLECWVKCPLVVGETQAVLGLFNSADDTPLLVACSSSGGVGVGSEMRLLFRQDDNTAVVDAASTGVDLFDDVWHHLAITWDGSALRVYIDAAEVIAETGLTLGTMTIDRVAFGALDRTSTIWHLNGELDEVAVYATALSASRISLHYQTRNN